MLLKPKKSSNKTETKMQKPLKGDETLLIIKSINSLQSDDTLLIKKTIEPLISNINYCSSKKNTLQEKIKNIK
jgi:hypothetical protein